MDRFDICRWNGRDGYFQPYGVATLKSIAAQVESCHREFPASAIKVTEWATKKAVVLDDDASLGLIGLLIRTRLTPHDQDRAEVAA